ncbi:XRE family transcriptional regulator [Streptomyces sp. NPDC002917]|uniref:XRE family transcriptional regulator n=1 Tax=Streptomyces sp. NPDC002917 TaxID=3364671 RepID=UPI0036B748E1
MPSSGGVSLSDTKPVSVAQHATGLDVGSARWKPSGVTGTASYGPLGAALRKARNDAGLSLRAAAVGAGLSYSTLSRIENGLLPMPSLDAAVAVARNVGFDEREVLRLAGPLAPPGAAELADPGLRRSLSGGRLSPGAVGALRQVHLRELASEFSAGLGAGRPVDVRLAAKQLRLALVASCRLEPGFNSDRMSYRIPEAASDSYVAQRLWSAHGVAHRLIADDSGTAPECRPAERASAAEREATYVASRILVPPALLAAELRRGPLPVSGAPAVFTAALERVASRFRVPVDWAAARLAEDRIGEFSW